MKFRLTAEWCLVELKSSPTTRPQRLYKPQCLLLVFNLSRTKSFISAQRRNFHRLRRPTCHWVMKRLLMFLKGHQQEKETQFTLNSEPVVADTLHPSLPALGSLLTPAIPAPIGGTSRLLHGEWIVTAALKGNKWDSKFKKKTIEVFIILAPEVVKSIFIILIFDYSLVWRTCIHH